jgi:SAM-dependent methyltransferase
VNCGEFVVAEHSIVRDRHSRGFGALCGADLMGPPRRLGPEAARNFPRREREGFFEKYLSGDAILDIGYRGELADADPITATAIGIDLDYPGYDGKCLPFPDESQDAVFASHVLEHIDDYVRVLADWYRVLKIGGHLVIAVPHRDLYERKAAPPSRFNGDHKRFYTPSLLLSEIEQSLPVAGYRVRSLRDIDEGFDYTIPPGRHAAGSYEIELVIEKIKIPEYAERLRPSAVAEETATFYVKLVLAAAFAQGRGRAADVDTIQKTLGALPVPAFSALEKKIREIRGESIPREQLVAEVRPILEPLVASIPFDEDFYLESNPDVKNGVAGQRSLARAHFVRHGYFEGRLSHSE